MVRASHKGRVIHEDGASAPSSFFVPAIRDTSYVCVSKPSNGAGVCARITTYNLTYRGA